MDSPKFKLSDIKISAVLVGAFIDNMTTMAVMMMLMAALASAGVSQDDAMARLKTVSGLLLNLIIGLGCTGLGGFVAGRMAKKAEILYGALVALAGIAIAIAFWEEGLPMWYHIAGIAGMLPMGMFGGHLAKTGFKIGSDTN